jgi:peptidoglycan lytic transglycosylase
MPLRQTIGISLALLIASTGATTAKAAEKSTAHHASAPDRTEAAKSPCQSGKTRIAHKAAHFRWRTRLVFHRGGRSRHHYRYAASGGVVVDPDRGPMYTTGYQEFGQAAWYDLVGSRTATGERLDTVTPTAAHRSLPLGSSAKVTDLDTGRSVIVKINDRGPFSRRFIIDLSPRAAEELGMRREGVAAVAVEPVAGPTTAVYQAASNTVTQ